MADVSRVSTHIHTSCLSFADPFARGFHGLAAWKGDSRCRCCAHLATWPCSESSHGWVSSQGSGRRQWKCAMSRVLRVFLMFLSSHVFHLCALLAMCFTWMCFYFFCVPTRHLSWLRGSRQAQQEEEVASERSKRCQWLDHGTSRKNCLIFACLASYA